MDASTQRDARFSEGVLSSLQDAMNVFVERNAVYKSNFRNVGDLMTALMPEGVVLKTAEDFTRWHIFELFIVKLTRYAKTYAEGGHEDSLKDMTVYLAILQGLDGEMRERLKSEALPKEPDNRPDF